MGFLNLLLNVFYFLCFTIDFCIQCLLAIFLSGGRWHEKPTQQKKFSKKTKTVVYLKSFKNGSRTVRTFTVDISFCQ